MQTRWDELWQSVRRHFCRTHISIWYGEAAFWCAHLRIVCIVYTAASSRLMWERRAYCACAGLQLIPIHYHTSFKSILFWANNALIIKYFTNTNIALILCARDIICPAIYCERGESLCACCLSLAYAAFIGKYISFYALSLISTIGMKPSHRALNFTRWNESTQKWLSHLVISAPI